jgi:hypothetical protein
LFRQIAAFFFDLVVFVFVFAVRHSWISSTDVRSWSSTPTQVRRPRPDERRAPPAPGAARHLRRPRGGPEDPGWLAGVPGGGPARPALGAGGAVHGAPLLHRAGSHCPHRLGRGAATGERGPGEGAHRGDGLRGRGGLRPDPEPAGPCGARGSTVPARPGRGEGEGGGASRRPRKPKN